MKIKFLTKFLLGLCGLVGVACAKMPKPQIITPDVISAEEFVDLGLPSGLKWGSCNLGAAEPHLNGMNYAWGCTKAFQDFNSLSHEAYKSQLLNEFPFEDSKTEFKDYGEYGDTLRLYVAKGEMAGEAFPSRFDAAYRESGGSWFMPSADDFEELLANTTHKWASLEGKKGWLLTSVHNSAAIFLPVSQIKFEEIDGWHSDGSYWTSQGSINKEDGDPSRAVVLSFNAKEQTIRSYYRKTLMPVRPVSK